MFYKQRHQAKIDAYIDFLKNKLGKKVQGWEDKYYANREKLVKKGILFKEDLPEFHETALLSKKKYLEKDFGETKMNRINVEE